MSRIMILVSAILLTGCATTHPSNNYGGGTVYRGGINDSKEYYDSVYDDAYPSSSAGNTNEPGTQVQPRLQ
jgi:hypothetical protein